MQRLSAASTCHMMLARVGTNGLCHGSCRELAQQVAAVARGLRAVSSTFRTVCIHGGADRAPQIAALGRQPTLLVATPGRLLDLMDSSAVSLGELVDNLSGGTQGAMRGYCSNLGSNRSRSRPSINKGASTMRHVSNKQAIM